MVTTSVLRRPDLPLPLREIPDPPTQLYCAGNVRALDPPAVAMVGSRRCTRQGREIAFALSRDLAGAGLTVVSGLAYGIDAAAHRGALASGGAPTVAVLGSGLDRIYPRLHERLAAEIIAGGGALVSEYGPSTGPRKHHFPARNRIVSGLCRGVVIVEASARSGSLISARLALEQGRDVMAVPSSVSSPLSAGCHRLIRDGAALVENAQQILETLGLELQHVPCTSGAAADDDIVLRHVAATVTPLDEIVATTGLAIETVLERLAELEIDGLVTAHGGGYIRCA